MPETPLHEALYACIISLDSLAGRDAKSLDIPNILAAYYEAIKASSIIRAIEETEEGEAKIVGTAKESIAAFCEGFHAAASSRLDDIIESTRCSLEGSRGRRDPEEMRRRAPEYEKLREAMSAKEFVMQYNEEFVK